MSNEERIACTKGPGCPLGHTDYGLGHSPCGCYYDSGVYRSACREHDEGAQIYALRAQLDDAVRLLRVADAPSNGHWWRERRRVLLDAISAREAQQ